jgi:hypothetical protein
VLLQEDADGVFILSFDGVDETDVRRGGEARDRETKRE